MNDDSQRRKESLIVRAKEEAALNPSATFKEIAERMDVHYMMLYSLLRREGVTLGLSQKVPSVLRRVENLLALDKNSMEIQQELGISKQYLHNLKIKYQLEIPGRPRENQEKLGKMEELFQRGYNARQVHLRTGFSKKYVYAYAHLRQEKKG